MARNEIDTLQEENKTLAYKLAHSKRQAGECQAALEELDAANASTLCFLANELEAASQPPTGSGRLATPIGELSGGGGSSSLASSARLLKRQQSQTTPQSLVQQILQAKHEQIARLTQQLNELSAELDDVRKALLFLNFFVCLRVIHSIDEKHIFHPYLVTR